MEIPKTQDIVNDPTGGRGKIGRGLDARGQGAAYHGAMKSPNGTPSPKPRPRILIVDDSAKVRQDLGLLFQLSGEVEVVGEAANGRDAAALALELNPDAVLMDLEMPVMDGYEATRLIKAGRPASRVIAFSVHTYPLARQKASQAGADEFVEKGAPLDAILRALKIEGRN